MGLEFRICHLSLFIITQDAFDIADSSSMQDGVIMTLVDMTSPIVSQ